MCLASCGCHASISLWFISGSTPATASVLAFSSMSVFQRYAIAPVAGPP